MKIIIVIVYQYSYSFTVHMTVIYMGIHSYHGKDIMQARSQKLQLGNSFVQNCGPF